MQKSLILVRGVPGSGKSTIAKLIAKDKEFVHLEADMFFIDKKGKYKYDKKLISEAHEWCKEQTLFSLAVGKSVVVSNTFVKNEFLIPYYEIAKRFGIIPNVIEVKGRFKNVHGCPEYKVDEMLRNWEELDYSLLISSTR